MAVTKSSRKKIEAVLAGIKPYIRMHGGEVELLKVKGSVATLRIFGACVGCALADLTYNKTIGSLIREEVPEIKKIIIQT